MVRLFETHKIRKTKELSGRLWDVTPQDGEHAGETFPMMVPGCIETYPGFGNYRGWISYETTFEAEGNVRLEFKGVSHFAIVYVDGKCVTEHYGSYTPFAVCVRDLAPGTHDLKVMADNSFDDAYALDIPNDYMSYGGISRGVVLEQIPDAYLSHVHVTPLREEDGAWTVRAEALCVSLSGNPDAVSLCAGETSSEGSAAAGAEKLESEGRETGVSGVRSVTAGAEKLESEGRETGVRSAGAGVECAAAACGGKPGSEGREAGVRSAPAAVRLWIAGQEFVSEEIWLTPGENRVIFEQLRIPGVTAWSMETPALYEVRAELLVRGEPVDDLIDRTGFRTVTVSGRDVLLNGKPLRIKGFCRHEDHPQYGCALPVQAIAHDLSLIKDMGANSVRTTHYPNDELFLDLCDELGILVWEENHARGLETDKMEHPAFEEQCEQVIREMITAHYNHPSIYIWGILNECGSDTEYGRTCYAAQYGLIRSLDTSRPCSSASCRFEQDLCQDLPDVCSWNMYPYWYDERTATQMATDVMTWVEEKGNGAGKPFLVTEVGAGGIYGFRDPSHDIWSEDLQAEILEKQLKELSELPGCMGMYIWQFCDVRVSRIWWAMRRPKSRNNKGVVDEYRRPKMAYRVVKEIFQKLPDYRQA